MRAASGRDPRHHILPQAGRRIYQAIGINTDHYTVSLGQAHHEALHRADYNAEFERRLGELLRERELADVSETEVVEIGVRLMKELGVPVGDADYPLVPYRSRRKTR